MDFIKLFAKGEYQTICGDDDDNLLEECWMTSILTYNFVEFYRSGWVRVSDPSQIPYFI